MTEQMGTKGEDSPKRTPIPISELIFTAITAVNVKAARKPIFDRMLVLPRFEAANREAVPVSHSVIVLMIPTSITRTTRRISSAVKEKNSFQPCTADGITPASRSFEYRFATSC